MKSIKDRAVGVILSTAMFFCAVIPSGCNSREAEDIRDIEEVTEQFVEYFGSGDEDELKFLVEEGFSYEIARQEKSNILLKIASKTEIEDIERIEIDREKQTAKARVVFSYIDIYEFSKDQTENFMSEDDYLEAVDSFKDRTNKRLTINYLFDEDVGKWIVKNRSAEKYMELFRDSYLINPVNVSPEDAIDMFNSVFEGVAAGNFDQPAFELEFDRIRVFDDVVNYDPALMAAAEEFAKAYFTYIVDHGYTLENEDGYPYTVTLKGKIPSREEILSYFSSDEHQIEMYMAIIRVESVDNALSDDEIWNGMYAEIYYDLAKRIPDMKGQDLSLDLVITGEFGDEPKVVFPYVDLLPITPDDVLDANAVSDEQAARCFQKAVESLYLAGELTQEQYEKYLAGINTASGRQPEDVQMIEWEGTESHANQAVNVYEYIPDWSDGTLIYGKSDEDQYGFQMHYSKQPGWLDTAGYCIGDDGITVMVRYDHKFSKGTVLEYDWALNGEKYGESGIYVVEENGQDTFEFTIPVKLIQNVYTCEFRLWEEGHTHVIAYVELY